MRRAEREQIKVEVSTKLQEILANGTDSEKADATACLIAGQPPVVGYIARCCVPELRELTLDETMRQIVGVIQVGAEPGKLYLASSTVADKRVGRGSVLFDVVVTIQLPDSARRARVIINIEAQGRIPSWEWITGRIDVYQSDLIMSQLGHEVIHENYNDLIDVYSVWLFLSPKASYARNHVQYEELGERWQDLQKYARKALRDTFRKARTRGDKGVNLDRLLARSIEEVEDAIHPQNTQKKETRFRRHYPPDSRMHVVKIFLGSPKKAREPLEKFVDVLFDTRLPADQKGDILESEFQIPKTITLMEDLRNMGTYSAAIIQEYDEKIADRDKKIADRDKKIADRDKKIADRDEKIADRDERIADLTEAVVNADKRVADASKRILLQFARKYLSAGMSPERALAELADIADQNGLSQQDLAEIVTNVQQLQDQKQL